MFKGSFFSEENSHLREWRDGNNAIIAELEKKKVQWEANQSSPCSRAWSARSNYSQMTFIEPVSRNIHSPSTTYLSTHSLHHFLQGLFLPCLWADVFPEAAEVGDFSLDSTHKGWAIPHILAAASRLQGALCFPLLPHNWISSTLPIFSIHTSHGFCCSTLNSNGLYLLSAVSKTEHKNYILGAC